MLSRPPFVGREEELGRLDKLLHQVARGSGGLVLLAGEAGIGKTMLANEFEIMARDSGCKVLIGNCLPSAQIPYLVFLEALNHLFEEKDSKMPSRYQRIIKASKVAAPDLVRTVPVIGGTLKASAMLFEDYREGKKVEVSKEHVLFRTLDILTKESSKMPLVLHLDDLQWADSMSIAMLHFLARYCRELRVLLLGTYRSEEVLNQEKGVHPLLDSIRVMKRERIVEEIQLKPLSRKEMDLAVTSMLEMPVNEHVLARIFKESEGNPLFAIETVRMLAGSNAFKIKDGEFHITSSLDEAIPNTVLEVITRRLERTSNDEKRILDFASVIGPVFDPVLLADASKIDLMEILEALEGLDARHQLVVERDSGFAFTHEKVRQIAYDGISKIRKKGIHRLVGFALEKRLPDNNLLGELSSHFDKADENWKCIVYSLMAGRFQLDNFAIPEAIQSFSRVVERTKTEPSFLEERIKAFEGLGDAFWLNDQDGLAFENFEACLNLNNGKEGRARVLLKAAGCWVPNALGQGGISRALFYFERAKECHELDELERTMMDETEGFLLFFQGRFPEAEASFERAIAGYGALDKMSEVLKIQLLLLDMAQNSSRIQEAKSIGESILNKAMQIRDPRTIMMAEVNLGETHYRMGDIDQAKGYLKDALKLAMKLQDDYFLFKIFEINTKINYLLGNLTAARENVADSMPYATRSNLAYLKALANIWKGYVDESFGEIEQAELHFTEADRMIASFTGTYRQICIWRLQYLQAKILAAKGLQNESNSLFEKLIEEHLKGQRWFEAVEGLIIYGSSLKKQGLLDLTMARFDEAMTIAKKICCEKRVMVSIANLGLQIP